MHLCLICHRSPFISVSNERTRRQIGRAHEVRVDTTRTLAAFPDGPDDERLAAAQVAAGEGRGRHTQPIHTAGFASTCWSKFSFSPTKTSNHGNLATLGRDLQRSYQA